MLVFKCGQHYGKIPWVEALIIFKEHEKAFTRGAKYKMQSRAYCNFLTKQIEVNNHNLTLAVKERLQRYEQSPTR
jgi:hypothetical protein